MIKSLGNYEMIATDSISSPLCMNWTRLLVIYLLNASLYAQTLVYSSFFGSDYQNDWVVQYSNGIITTCGSDMIFGGQPNFHWGTIIEKNIELLPHTTLQVKFKFWHIDNWGGENIDVLVDNNRVYYQTYDSQFTSPSICGESGPSFGDGVSSVDVTTDHQNANALITIIGHQNYWGISSFQVWTTYSIQGCNSLEITNRFNEAQLISKFNQKLYYRDRLLQPQVILTFTSCFEQQKVISSGDYVMQEFNLEYHGTTCISLKQLSSISNPYYIYFYINDKMLLSSKSSNEVSSQVICDVQILKETTVLYSNYYKAIKLRILAYWLLGSYVQTFNLDDFPLVIFLKDDQDCLDENKDPFDGCFSGRYDCTQGCSNCIRGLCIECQKGWDYDILDQTCQPICGDQIITYNEECDDGNIYEFDGCFQCKFSCVQFCKQCVYGQCLQCQSSYQLIDKRCVEVNGISDQKSEDNTFIQISNQLYYGNYYHKLLHDQFADPLPVNKVDCNMQTYEIFGYYYHQRSTKQILNCLYSQFDKCLECEIFYKLSWNKKECIPQCDDGIKIEYEFCDDQNNAQFDGCYKCQASCQLECILCIELQCYACLEGWQIIDNKCFQKCGDGQLAVSSQEQCDDGNDISYDDCNDCKFVCDQNCFSCATSNLCFLCNKYFELDANKLCKPKCGDGIILFGLEECEDLNNIPYDGCYQCMFQCDLYCSKCNQGICFECYQGYELHLDGCKKILIPNEIDYPENQNNKPQCGDGNQTNSEQCDDANQDNFDGCSSRCKIEENWICTSEQPNQCYVKTIFSLIYQNQTYEHQYVVMQFSNQVKQISTFNFTQSILSKILNLNQDQYQITVNPVVNVSDTQFTIGLFEFDVLFLDSASILPNLSISINQSLIDSNNMPVDLPTQTILLQQPKVLTKEQINVANKFQNFGNALMIGLGAFSVLMLFIGDPQQSVEIFDTLQFQSYLKFINVIYPQNLLIYFRASEIVSVSPILITFKLTDFFYSIFQQNFIKSIGKLSEYQINADLLQNIQSQMSQFSLIALLYIFLQFYPKYSLKYCFTSNYFQYISSSKYRVVEKVGIQLYKFNQQFINIKQLYTMKGLKQICYANAWDLLFKVILFMASNNESGIRSNISQCISIGVLSMFAYFLSLHCKGLTKHLDIVKFRNEQHEGICLLKKMIFILTLIDFQESDIFQCAMITALIFSYIGFLLMIKQNIPKLELIGIIWMEAPVMLFTLTSLVYCSDFYNYLSTEFQIFLGFCQIGILILGLLGPLVKLGIKLQQEIQQYCRKRKLQNPQSKVEVTSIHIFDEVN
ncbi:unnamed protein product [Paramecium octaurelia]|uniref:Uncharacterized protein n=1 Tax=Paramecium octaurelia TaxID=43137 RepID=A0A8S1YPC1_PAROT|nr:unnamed protein product [Paramecium octaurelia]